MEIHPPKKAVRFLRWFCKEDFVEEIEGDLTELYLKEYPESCKGAKRRFVWRVLKYFRPEFIKSFKPSYQTNFQYMLRHNFLIALRNFYRHRNSFVINLIGLTSGLACTILIYLWVSDEMNIDKFNLKDRQLYQVMQNFHNASGISTGGGTQGPLAAALAMEMPEVEYATTIVPPNWFSSKGVITLGDNHIKANPQFVSKDFLKVFTCDLILGDNKNILPDQNSITISDELAIKLFKTTQNLIGKIVQWDHQEYSDTYHITGVFEKLPSNATTQFDVLLNFETYVAKRKWNPNWDNSDPSTFIILKEGTDIGAFNKKIAGFIKTKNPKSESTLFVQQFSDRYLYGNYENGVPSGGRIFYVRLLSIVGFFILAIACINFMNLSTAKATRRIREVGVKKAIGAARTTLIWQYISESGLVTLISLLLALGLAYFLLPQFNTITGKCLLLKFTPQLSIGITLMFILTSVLAGSYPALYLSGFSPATVLTGKLATSLGELLTRKGLVIFQFAISVILIVGVLVVYNQMEYIQNKNLGYSKENIVSFEMEGVSVERLKSFHGELEKIPGVIKVGMYGHNLTGDHGSIELDWEGKTASQHMEFANIEVGEGFIETMGIEFKEGHAPSMSINPESQIILNEKAIEIMGLKDPIGKKVRYWGIESEVVGVTKNFNFESLHEPIKPSFFRVYPISPFFIVKIQGGSEKTTLERIQKLYSAFASGYPFDFKFLDEDYDKLYASEQRVSVLSRYFAGIAIIISCLGLLGLATFTAEKRLKEIGIRKVLGSSVTGIVLLLSLDFTKIVLTSILVAIPISYFMTKTWLNEFAYRIDLQWWYFITAGLGALLIAWVTVGVQTIRAASINPTQCLRTE